MFRYIASIFLTTQAPVVRQEHFFVRQMISMRLNNRQIKSSSPGRVKPNFVQRLLNWQTYLLLLRLAHIIIISSWCDLRIHRQIGQSQRHKTFVYTDLQYYRLRFTGPYNSYQLPLALGQYGNIFYLPTKVCYLPANLYSIYSNMY